MFFGSERAYSNYNVLFKGVEQPKPKTIPHADLDKIFEILSGLIKSEVLTAYLYHEAVEIARKFKKIRGVVGVAGLGYPFYSIDQYGNPIEVPEIQSFIRKVRRVITEDAKENPDGWNVPECPHSLSAPCTSCAEAILSPREVSKGILDLDMVVIVDEPSESTEQDVEKMLNDFGYRQSDTSVGEALLKTKSNLESLEEGKYPEEKIPIDIHIWSKSEVERCLDSVAAGETDVKINGRALHAGWVDHEINFWFDFVFSFTELGQFDSELAEKILYTRKKIKEMYSFEEIAAIVIGSSARAARLMQSEDVVRVLEEKIASW